STRRSDCRRRGLRRRRVLRPPVPSSGGPHAGAVPAALRGNAAIARWGDVGGGGGGAGAGSTACERTVALPTGSDAQPLVIHPLQRRRLRIAQILEPHTERFTRGE